MDLYTENEKARMSSAGAYTIITLFTLLELLGNKAVIECCMNEGIIAERVECPKCGCDTQLSERCDRTDSYEWRCRKQGKVNAHDVKRSVRRGTWFKSNHLNISKILKMTRFWYMRSKKYFVRQELNVSEHTIVDWCMFCHEVRMLITVNESVPLGGKGVIVEIDESKFGKMKYGKGKHVNGQWVFGGIERATDKCFF